LKRLLSSVLFLFFSSSCGYRWTSANDLPPSVEVPYLTGDEDGSLTSEIIRTLNARGIREVRRSDARYRLEGSILGGSVDTIGYRRDPQLIRGKISKNLVSTEARKTLTLQVSLIDTYTGKELLGPVEIVACEEFDYVDGDSIPDLIFTNPSGIEQTVLSFSLGQLESSEAAQEAATRPLYRKIAQKVVDAISSSW
jgi:hypothetical protein